MIQIRLKNISKTYGDKTILNNISLDIDQSKLYIILGESGAGKTTLLNIMGMLDTPTEGDISILGKQVSELDDNGKSEIRMKNIGFVFQSFFLNQKLKVYENVMIPMYINKSYKRKNLKDKAISLLELFGVDKKFDKYPNELSGGEQQRVAISRAIANDASIIIADEPTGNLDDDNEEKVLEYFKMLALNGKSIILVTHNKSLVKYADKVLLLKDGILEEL